MQVKLSACSSTDRCLHLPAQPCITTLDGFDLEYVGNYKYLGVWLDCKLSFYKSLLGKAPPYLSSLVTIAAPTRSMHSSRYISLVTPKVNSSFGRLSFQFSAANDWNEFQKSLKLESHISLTNFNDQLSEQLTDHCT
jgi:hypothetical protein